MKILPILASLLALAPLAGRPADADAAPGPQPGSYTLAQALDAALAHYPTLDEAQSAVDSARARTLEANSSRLTQVALEGDYQYNSLRPYVSFALPEMPAGTIYENVQDNYGAGVTAHQLLTDFGRTDALVALARTGEISARDALEGVRRQLGYETIQAFYGTLLLSRSVDVADEEIRALQEALRISQQKFSAGSATRFDVLTTQVRLAAAENRRTDTVAALQRQEAMLRRLIGLEPGTPVAITGDFATDRTAPALADALAEGMDNRPEVKLAQDDETAARQRLDAAARESRPTLGASATAEVDNGNMPSLYDHRGSVTAGVSLSVPLFTGRRITGDRLEAGASVRSAEARIREMRAVVGNDVESALADFGAARARLGNADALVDQAQEALALADTRYSNGVITNFERLDAQSAARSAELARLQARYDCVLAWQAVAQAAGRPPAP